MKSVGESTAKVVHGPAVIGGLTDFLSYEDYRCLRIVILITPSVSASFVHVLVAVVRPGRSGGRKVDQPYVGIRTHHLMGRLEQTTLYHPDNFLFFIFISPFFCFVFWGGVVGGKGDDPGTH